METLVLIPDIQCPQQDDKAISIARKLIEHIKPQTVVYLGDIIAADSVSSYSKKTWDEANKTLRFEADETNKILDKFDKTFKKAKVKKIYYLEGNHEQRILKYIVKNAQPIGDILALRVESLLKLEERGYKYVMLMDQPLKINHFNIIHGWYVNKYHAFKTVSNAMKTTFYGHSHDYQVHTITNVDEKPRMGMSCGCLCELTQNYNAGRPTNWMKGLTVIYYDKDSFAPYFIPIIKDRAIFNGKVF